MAGRDAWQRQRGGPRPPGPDGYRAIPRSSQLRPRMQEDLNVNVNI